MDVEIYLDSLFFLNFILNYLILELLLFKFSLKIRFARHIFASVLGAATYVLLFFIPGNSLILPVVEHIVSVPVMMIILLPKRKRRYFYQMVGMGFFYSFVVAGILRVIFVKWKLFLGKEITMASVIFGVLLCVKTGKCCIKKMSLNRKRCIYDVMLISGGQKLSLKALLDTGNSLVEPISKKPVCIIEEEYLAKITLENQLFLRAIPYRSVGCEKGMLYGVELPEMECKTENDCYYLESVICAGVGHKLSSNASYQMILHPMLLTEENIKKERKK